MTRINSNVTSLVAQQTLARSNSQLQTSLTRLSTGLRINSGKDDPAGLIASEVLRSDIISVERAITNSERANQLIATADSALNQVSGLLNDVRGLVSEAANTGALSDEQIAANQLQVDSSLEAIDRIAQTTVFQGRRLLDGSLDFLSTASGTVDTTAAGNLGANSDVSSAVTITGGAGTDSNVYVTAEAVGTSLDGYLFETTTNGGGAATIEIATGATPTVTVHVADGTTSASVASLINNDSFLQNLFTASAGGAGTGAVGATAVDTTEGGTDANLVTVSASAGGTDFNDVDIVLTTAGGASKGAESATYSGGAGGTLTVQVAATSTATEIAAAIGALTDFNATATGSGSGIISATTTTYTDILAGGTSGAVNISNLDIQQANFGTASSISVQIEVDTQATQASLTYSAGSLSSDLILEIGGSNGFEVFNFGNTTTQSQVRDAINLVSDSTGVTATVSGSDLVLNSSSYGSKSFVSARALQGDFVTYDSGSVSDRDTGSDVSLRINGVQATGDGLVASLNTSTLDLSFNVNENVSDGDQINFSITGGGAIFQLGPEVTSNQQARIGIGGVSTAKLGGVNGTLFELRSGGAKSLTNDVKSAGRVIEEVISQVTGLRGRLGAFQRATLETNIFTLSDALENLTDAESSIRDADFAKESAALTRAQILVTAGTSVLAIANSNPQNVLSLLR